MSDRDTDGGAAEVEAEREAELETETETEVETESETTDEAVIDMEAAAQREESVEALQQTVEEQREQIENLKSQVLDLSTRVAHDGGIGVCDECNGPVMKRTRLFRSNTVECQKCGKVFHEY